MLEGRHHQLAHVAFVKGPGARRQAAYEVEVGEPDLDELLERAVGRRLAAAAGMRRPLGQPLLEPVLGELRPLDEIGAPATTDGVRPKTTDPLGVVTDSPSLPVSEYPLGTVVVRGQSGH